MKEIRKLMAGDLRNLCISKSWYTRGSNTEYANILSLAANCENVDTSTIVKIAEDILLHSETDYPLESICFEIAAICNSVFEQEKIILTFDHEDNWGRAVFKGNNEKLYVTTNLIPRIGWEALDQEGRNVLLQSLNTRTSFGEPNSPCWNENKFCIEGVIEKFDICAVCKNNNTEECSSCEIRHVQFNNFQPDGRKVIINNKLQLYAHFVKCTKKCGEIENGKCGAGRFEHERCKPVKVLIPLPEDGKCLFPNFFPYSGLERLETEGLEENERIIDDIPF